MSTIDIPLTHRRLKVGDIALHLVEAGSGPPVLLLHGFPEFWYSWRHQIPALAKAGFHAIAPDLRGYNESDRPTGVRAYRVQVLVEDIAQLIQTLGYDRAFIVGHDWGGIIAWRLAALQPDRMRKLVILNAPHPARFRRELMRNPAQWLRSSYVAFFQLPWLPERFLSFRRFSLLERAWRRQPLRADAFTDADVARYKQALGKPGGLSAPLNYYRAAMRWPQDLYGPPQIITQPTLLLWGEHDAFLSPRLSRSLSTWVPDLQVQRFSDASHWLQNDAPAAVNDALVGFCE
jgi:epoxide hydrolase 4